ncbi:sigma 54-interacting transcriptional regulator [Sorangium sp. So ce542]|uniref:sigma 54-interacting transcriptional regulator n=1 Tax=Sorangium sp. So ce542 TaxID=3133316 RepID=UPI003F5EFDAF
MSKRSEQLEARGTRVIEAAGAPRLVVPRGRLAAIDGPGAGRAIALDAAPVTVGASDDVDLTLADPAVSARHLEIAATPLGFRLRDLGSTNGTFVDGRRTGEVWLGQAAEIRAGETRLSFAVEEGTREIPLSRATDFGELLGHSPAMRAAFAILDGAARTDATVLILGESGTGKELAARAVHERSPRRDGPFVIFDCGAASPTLLEAQLFGHARGAFTGATGAREGIFEAAHGGTLVLDEIGELPLELQPKLLRALEARTVCRLGESKPRTVDVRYIACTHRLLDAEVRAGRFRQDLFFRLSVVVARLPPLRERPEEIPRLVRHFLGRLAPGAVIDLPEAVLDLLVGHAWPGNVRELRNVVERFLALPGVPAAALLGIPGAAPGGAEHAGLSTPVGEVVRVGEPFHEAKRVWTERFEQAYLEALLARAQGNVSEAARLAGLSRQTCYRLMQKHGLRVD